MASELAEQIDDKWYAGQHPRSITLPDVIDTELQEVREVLDLCEAAMTASIPHVPPDLEIALRERIRRAKQLYSKLLVKE